jgi:glycosyltransferase involved in cell wall biosynthesis
MRRQLATLELADLIWCPSEFVQRSLVEEGVPIGKTFVSPLGVDTDRIKRGVRSVEKSGEFHILFVGNVGLQKGIHVLLRALQAARITNAVLILNGQPDPAARDLLLEFTPHLEAKRIVIRIDPGDPRRHLPNADLFVLPSVHDSYGIVVVEAMTAGLPIVVSSNVGAREILKHGKNALVFQSGDYTGLSDCLSQLHDQPDRRSTLGRAAQEESGKYDARITAARLAKRLAAE